MTTIDPLTPVGRATGSGRPGPTGPASPGPAARYGIGQVVRAEWIKITTLRSTLWTLLITLAGTALVTVLSTQSARHQSASWYRGFDPTNQSLSGALVGILTMGVFGVLVVTGEYASGTIRSSLSAQPRRLTFLAGKVGDRGGGPPRRRGDRRRSAASISVRPSWPPAGAPHASLGQAGVARAVLLTGVYLALFGVMGMALGVIVRSTAGAISSFVGLAFLLPLVLHQVSGQPDRFTPVQMLSSSVSVTMRSDYQVSPTVALVLMVVYTAGLAGLGLLLFTSRDA